MKRDKRSPQERAGLAQKMKAIRTGLNLDKPQMSRRLGMSTSAYHRYESGERYPGTAVLRILAEELNISINWLLFNKGEKYISTNTTLIKLQTENEDLKKNQANMDEVRAKKEKLALLEPIATLLTNHEAKIGQFPSTQDLKPEILEMIHAMHKSPRIHYELLLHFHKVKEDT